MKATTDSESIVRFDEENKPGISNLINIYSALTNKSIDEIENEFKDANYGTFKKCVCDVVIEELSKIREKYFEYGLFCFIHVIPEKQTGIQYAPDKAKLAVLEVLYCCKFGNK